MTEPYKACGAQLDYPPEAKGVPIEEWENTHRVVVDRAELSAWLAKHGPDAKEKLESKAATTKRDRYGK